MGHEGCCHACAQSLAQVTTQVAELHMLITQLAESMSKMGSNPLARNMLRSMGITMPEIPNGTK